MSMKIPNGAKIKDAATMTTLMAFIGDIRAEVRDAVHELRAKEVKQMAALIYDMYHSKDNDIINPEVDQTRVPLLIAMNRLVDGDLKKENTEDYSICFSTHKGTTYAIPYFHEAEILRVFRDHPKVSDFRFWNNTDKPEDLTDQQWEKRALVWDAILSSSGVPAESMLTIRLIDSKFLIPDDKFMKDAPTVEQREEQLARIVSFQVAEDRLEEDEDERPTKERLADFAQIVKDVYEEELEKIKGTLEPITMDDLSQDIPLQEKGEESGEERVSETSSTD